MFGDNGNSGGAKVRTDEGGAWRHFLMALLFCAASSGVAAAGTPTGELQLVEPGLQPEWERGAFVLPDRRVVVVSGSQVRAQLWDAKEGVFRTMSGQRCSWSDYTITSLPDGRVVMVGGRAGGRCRGDELSILDPKSGVWSSGPPLQSGRGLHTATLLGNGTVLLAGGKDAAGKPQASAEIFDGRTTLVAPMNVARMGHTATRLKDGRVLVAGGDRGEEGPTQAAELWDPDQHAWRVLPPMTVARTGHSAFLLQDGSVMVVGGFSADRLPLSGVEIWNPESGQWRQGSPLPIPAGTHSAGQLPNGDILLAGSSNCYFDSPQMLMVRDAASGEWHYGGGEVKGATVLPLEDGSAYIIDSKAILRWSPTQREGYGGPMFPTRTAMEARLADGRLLLMGETTPKSTYNGCGDRDQRVPPRPLGLAELFNPETNTFSPTGPLRVPRDGAQLLALKDGRAIVAGGHSHVDGRRAMLEQVPSEIWDPASDRWRDLAPELQTARWETSRLNQLGDGRVLFFFSPAGIEAEEGKPRAIIWDPQSEEVSEIPVAVAPDGPTEAVVATDGRVLLRSRRGTGEEYARSWDSRSGVVTTLSGVSAPEGSHWRSLPLRDGRVIELLVTGADETTDADMTSGPTQARMWEPSRGAWSTIDSLPATHHAQDALLELADGAVYADTSTGGWVLPASGRGWLSMAAAGARGRVLSASLGNLQGRGERLFFLDPVRVAWRPIDARYLPRGAPAMALLADGRVMVAGGSGEQEVQLWNPADDEWTSAAELPMATREPQAVRMPSGRILLVDHEECALWDPDGDVWTRCAAWRQLGVFALRMTEDGRAVSHGESVAVYDESTNTWTKARFHTRDTKGAPPAPGIIVDGTEKWVGLASYDVLPTVFRSLEWRKQPQHALRLPDGCSIAWSPIYVIRADGEGFAAIKGVQLDIEKPSGIALADGTVVFAGGRGARADAPDAGFARIKAGCDGVTGIAGSLSGNAGVGGVERIASGTGAASGAPAEATNPWLSPDMKAYMVMVSVIIGLVAGVIVLHRHEKARAVARYLSIAAVVVSCIFALGHYQARKAMSECRALAEGEPGPGDELAFEQCVEARRGFIAHLSQHVGRGPGASPADFCAYVGIWNAERAEGTYLITLREDGTFRAIPMPGTATLGGDYTGRWRVEDRKMTWNPDGIALPYQDVNPIIQQDEESFTLREVNGQTTHFTLRSPLAGEACQTRAAQ